METPPPQDRHGLSYSSPHDADFHRANPLLKGYGLFAHGATSLQSAVLLLFRLSIGWKIYLSGYRHLFVNLHGTIDAFRNSFHVPMPELSVYVSGTTELVGGVLLMLGLATRLISVPLAFNFLVAILTAGRKSVTQAIFGGKILDPDSYNPGHLGGLEAVIDDTAFPFLLTALATLAFGAGKVSLDYFIERTLFRKGHKTGGVPDMP